MVALENICCFHIFFLALLAVVRICSPELVLSVSVRADYVGDVRLLQMQNKTAEVACQVLVSSWGNLTWIRYFEKYHNVSAIGCCRRR